MTPTTEGRLIAVGMLFVLGGIGAAIAPLTSGTKMTPNSTDVHQQQATSEPQIREWSSTFNGAKVECFQSAQTPDSRGFVIIPTREQIEDGEHIFENRTPSDEAWNSVCGQ